MSGEGIGAKGLKTKLIINYIPQSLTDAEFKCIFSAIGDLQTCNVMRDKETNYSFGYGFVDYILPSDAEMAIKKLNGYNIMDKRFKVAFAKPPGSAKNSNLYVSGLTPDINEEKLKELFGQFGEVAQTRLLRNKDGSSKQVGFVVFKEQADAEQAMNELCDQFQIKFANPSYQTSHPKYHEFVQKQKVNQQPMMGTGYNSYQQPMGYQGSPYMDGGFSAVRGRGRGAAMQTRGRGRGAARFNPMSRPTPGGLYGGASSQDDGTSLFVYNTGPDATDNELYQLFGKYGHITKVDMVTEKGFAFVHMPVSYEAFAAMNALNDTPFHGRKLQVTLKKGSGGSSGGPSGGPSAGPFGVASQYGGMGTGPGSSSQDSDNTVLFVYNTGQDATDHDLYALFGKYGRISKVDLLTEKGFGFVHMPNSIEAFVAMNALNGTPFNGKNLKVSVRKVPVKKSEG